MSGSRPSGLELPARASRASENATGCSDEHCDELGRDPGTIERACFIGWSDSETPFASREAFRDFVGRYRDAGVQRFVFSLGGPETPDPYSKWVASGAWTDRGSMDQFAAQEMKEIQRSS